MLFRHAVGEIVCKELAKGDVIDALIGTAPEIEARVAFRQADRPALLRHRNIPNLIVIANSQSDLKDEIFGKFLGNFNGNTACPGIVATDCLGNDRFCFRHGNGNCAAVFRNGDGRRAVSLCRNGISIHEHCGKRFAAYCIGICSVCPRKSKHCAVFDSHRFAVKGDAVHRDRNIHRRDDNCIFRRHCTVGKPIIFTVRIVGNVTVLADNGIFCCIISDIHAGGI